ncbi:HD domain-containing protein [Lutimaribacter marinistellae]|uniref:HD domain-containing protein n=1 Tax=Lutimaribacter marinistellae TaxID=1820329 RepID=A0ABV7TBI5_9RHOB
MAISADLRSALRAEVTARMAQDPAHDLAHLDRVWANAQAICDHMPSRILLAASYLHDLVNLPKDDPERHLASRRSAEAARPVLMARQFTADEIEETCHAIEAHSFSACITPNTQTARILRDADRLDALGAIGIARCFAVSGALGRDLYDPVDPFAQTRDPDDKTWSLDHFRVKLLRLPDEMLTARGAELAHDRAARMIVFLDTLASEIGTRLPDDWRA